MLYPAIHIRGTSEYTQVKKIHEKEKAVKEKAEKKKKKNKRIEEYLHYII